MSMSDETDEPLDPEFEAELDAHFGRPLDDDQAEQIKRELVQYLREELGYAPKPMRQHTTQLPKRKKGEYFTCSNGHVWTNLADSLKCCDGFHKVVIVGGVQEVVMDWNAIRPLGDEFEKMAKKGNRHSLGDELFKRVRK